MQGDEVRWLRRSSMRLGGVASDPEHGDVYDEELAIAVQNFQREHRLNVDGIAGRANPGRARHGVGRTRLAPAAAQRAARRLGIAMSFILDALKKSEIERQRQSMPGLMDTRLSPAAASAAGSGPLRSARCWRSICWS